MTAYVTRRETFNAGHRLFNPSFSDEHNLEVFGKCANPNGHGHNYVLEVTVAGEIDADTGYVIDLKDLSDVVTKVIVDDVDHRNLNTDVDWLAGMIPTAEVLAQAFWDRLDANLPARALHSVRLWETENNLAEVRREP